MREVVIAIGAGAMVSGSRQFCFGRGWMSPRPLPVRLEVPLALGVPEMRPVDAPKALRRAAGSEPEVIDRGSHRAY